MIHDLRMAWAFFRALRMWRSQGSGLVVVECHFDDNRRTVFSPRRTTPEPCPTCQGRHRWTAGMVCQTCGRDYGPDATPEPTP